METSLLLLAASLMFSGVRGISESMSCSTVNGRQVCERQTSSGNTAMSSSQSATGFGAPDYQRAYAGAGDTNTGSYSSSQTQRGVPPSGLFFNPFASGAFEYDYNSHSSSGGYNYDTYSSSPRGYDYDTYSSSRRGYDYDTYSPRRSFDYTYGDSPTSAGPSDYDNYSSGSSANDYDKHSSVSAQDYAYGGYPAATGEFGVPPSGVLFNPFASGAFDYDYSSYSSAPGGYNDEYPSNPRGYDYNTYSSDSGGNDYTYSSVSSQDYAYGGYPAAARGFGQYPPGGFPVFNPFGFGFGGRPGAGAFAFGYGGRR